MRVLKIIGGVVVILIVAMVVFALLQPEEGHYERSIVIDAPPEVIYEEIDDVRSLDAWSPWYELDTAAFTYEGPESGVGGISRWESEHPELGAGSSEIIETEENKMVKTRLQFYDSDGNFYSTIRLDEAPEGTKVTWSYDFEDLDLMMRFFTGFMDMDEMMSTKFDAGLNKLKQIAESKPSLSNGAEIVVVNVEPITYIGLEATVDASNSEAISATMAELYGKLMKYSEETSTEMTGAPIAVYKSFGEDEVEVVCGLPVAEGTTVRHEQITVGSTLGGEAVKTVHRGAYDNLPFTYDKLNQFMQENNFQVVGQPYEIYITDPEEVSDTAQWVTEVYYPIGNK